MTQITKKDPISQEENYSKLIKEINQRFDKITNLLENRQEKFETPDKLRPAQVCKIMGWSRSKFEQFKREGLFRTHKCGGMVYAYSSDLKKLFPKDFF